MSENQKTAGGGTFLTDTVEILNCLLKVIDICIEITSVHD